MIDTLRSKSKHRVRPTKTLTTITFRDKRRKLLELYESNRDVFLSRFDKMLDVLHKSYKIYLNTSMKKTELRRHIRSFLKQKIRFFENYIYCGAFDPIPPNLKDFLQGLYAIINDNTNTVRLQRTTPHKSS